MNLKEALKVSEVERTLDNSKENIGASIDVAGSKVITKAGRGGLFLVVNPSGGMYHITPSVDLLESDGWEPM